MGFEYSSVYAVSKFGLEGWMGALEQEVAPFGIRTTIANPGFFRTGLASPESLVWPEVAVADYAERNAAQRACGMPRMDISRAIRTSSPTLCSRLLAETRHRDASSLALT